MAALVVCATGIGWWQEKWATAWGCSTPRCRGFAAPRRPRARAQCRWRARALCWHREERLCGEGAVEHTR